MRILISAYACEPGAGSEPGAGWSWARASALAENDVWLLTRANNCGDIDAALRHEPNLRITPVYLDLPLTLQRIKRIPGGHWLYYLLWQWRARTQLLHLHQEREFHIAHHITFATDWMPAAAVGIPRLPSIWGPVGGASPFPIRACRWLGPRGLISEAARQTFVRTMRRTVGGRMARNADITIAQNGDVARYFARFTSRIFVEPNVALSIPPTRGETPVSPQPGAGIHVRSLIFVGRLVPWKGLSLTLAVLRRLGPGWSLQVIGDGPYRKIGENKAARLGLANRVTFHGALSREQVIASISAADVTILPSLHDSASWVVGESATVGTPAVVLDIGGPATVVSLSKAGKVVPFTQDIVERLAEAVEQVANHSVGYCSRWDAGRLPTFLSHVYSSL